MAGKGADTKRGVSRFAGNTTITYREEIGRDTGSIRIVKTVRAADGKTLWEMDVCEVEGPA